MMVVAMGFLRGAYNEFLGYSPVEEDGVGTNGDLHGTNGDVHKGRIVGEGEEKELWKIRHFSITKGTEGCSIFLSTDNGQDYWDNTILPRLQARRFSHYPIKCRN